MILLYSIRRLCRRIKNQLSAWVKGHSIKKNWFREHEKSPEVIMYKYEDSLKSLLVVVYCDD
jgi:hypothetical protein